MNSSSPEETGQEGNYEITIFVDTKNKILEILPSSCTKSF